jgi:ABC-2 type transport system permease protein
VRRPAISKRYSLRSRRKETAEGAENAKPNVFSAVFANSAVSSFRWLVAKEYRELMASRAWWVMLVAIGPLVGVTFISAVRTYGEASGLNGTTAGVGEAFSPLIGIWAPTFSACEVAAVFLLPFVAIRLVSGDRQSGALKIEMQHPLPTIARVAAKAVVLLGGWLAASLAPLAAALLWKSYGGSIYAPEMMTVALGHFLNAGLTIALASAAAALTEHPSTAAILTLTVTVGTWILNFIAAVQGGIWEQLAGYTPPAMIAQFQHGLIRLDVVVVAAALMITGLVFAALWLRLGVPVQRRIRESIVLAAVAVVAVLSGSAAWPSWDLSENRMNSFAEADERVLADIRSPLAIEVHLAPEDPRRADLDRKAIAKLRRVLPAVHVRYLSSTAIGLFEQNTPHYGEIWYELGGKKEMSRSTTAEGALEAIYDLAGVKPPVESDNIFRGHPLAVAPKGAAALFYGIWPASVVVGAFFIRRRQV